MYLAPDDLAFAKHVESDHRRRRLAVASQLDEVQVGDRLALDRGQLVREPFPAERAPETASANEWKRPVEIGLVRLDADRQRIA